MLVGLHPDHIGYFYEKYAKLAPNYHFNPKFKLGTWDGKIHFFHKTGKTYVNLLDTIIPSVINLGYEINLIDERTSSNVNPEPITDQFFNGVKHPITGEPWVMRDYQVDMVNTLLESGGGVGIAGTGAGKALSMDAKILTPTGWRLNQDITPGDVIVTPKGTLTKVVDVFPQPIKQLYEITFHDGAKVKCCADHLWKVFFPKQPHKAWTEERIVTTSDIITFLDRKRTTKHTPGNISIPLVDSIAYPSQPLPIPPYALGALIGDGTLRKSGTLISSADEELLNNVMQDLREFDVRLQHRTNYDYGIVKKAPHDSFPPSKNKLTESFTTLNLSGKRSFEKSIPEIYKTGSIHQRWELIRGLFDTDGTADKNGNVSFSTSSKQLALDVQEVVWSLGGTCTINSRKSTYTHNGIKQTGLLSYTCQVRHQHPKQFFALSRKKDRVRSIHTDGRIQLTRRITSVMPVEVGLSQCLSIDDPDHLYVTNDFIVTHNTSVTAALALAYEHAADLRSIIIVPDKGLNHQTFEEYQNFGLDVGRYSGEVKDGNHQHIVSTWQTLQNNPTFIQQFDVVIVDEAHGLRGAVLSELMNKYGKDIPYRFGVTGTLPKAECDAFAVMIAVGSTKYTIPAHKLQEMNHLAQLKIDIYQHVIDLKAQYDLYMDETDDPKPKTYRQFKDKYFPEYRAEKAFLQLHEPRLQWIADYIIDKHEYGTGNVLCLVNGINFGKKLAKYIPGSIFLHGADKTKDRKQIYDMFQTRDDMTVIATVNIASTGLDIPRIFNMIGIDMGKSFIRTIQAIGRGLRKAGDKDFVLYTDVCADLKYSRKHLTERKKYFKEAKYPFNVHTVDLSQ